MAAWLYRSPLFSTTDRSQLADLMLKRGLPGMFGSKENVEAGGLMSYSADSMIRFDASRRTSIGFSRVAKSSNLPVEQAVRTGDQSKDRQGTWPGNSGDVPAARRRGDRVKRRALITLLGGAADPARPAVEGSGTRG